jgi:group I intron endonuclease
MFSIYLVTNKCNGKVYVGQTKFTSQNRWLKHQKDARLGRDTFFCRAILKHGSDAFNIENLVNTDSQQDADNLEKCWIVALQARNREHGYNITIGGEGVRGYKHSPERLEKMRLAMLGRNHTLETIAKMKEHKFSDEHRAKLDAKRFGRPMSEKTKEALKESKKDWYPTDEHKEKISLAMKGRKFSTETLEKMSAAQKGRIFSEETLLKMSISAKVRCERQKQEKLEAGI